MLILKQVDLQQITVDVTLGTTVRTLELVGCEEWRTLVRARKRVLRTLTVVVEACLESWYLDDCGRLI